MHVSSRVCAHVPAVLLGDGPCGLRSSAETGAWPDLQFQSVAESLQWWQSSRTQVPTGGLAPRAPSNRQWGAEDGGLRGRCCPSCTRPLSEVTLNPTLFPCRSFQGTEAVRGKSTHRVASGPVLTAWSGRTHLRPRPPSSPPTSGPLPQPAAVLRTGQWPGAPTPRAGAGLGDLTLGLGVLPLLTWSLLP